MKFPEKLWNLVNESGLEAIHWGNDGTSIIIDFNTFETEILWRKPDVFKTKSVVSFIRQLNLYGFRKCSRNGEAHEFQNPHFVRERKDLLKFMRRNLRSNLPISLDDEKYAYDEPKRKNWISLSNVLPEVEQPSSSHSSYPLSSVQELSPEYWWGNSMHALNTMKNFPSNGESILPNVVGDQNNAEVKAEENQPWGNAGMQRNIIFVPVPVPFGMYPGFFNSSLPVPYSLQHQDDIKNYVTSEQGNYKAPGF